MPMTQIVLRIITKQFKGNKVQKLIKEENDRMKAKAEQNAAVDKAEREKIDKMNQADSMIFTTENFLKDNADKIPADKKPAINVATVTLKRLSL